MNMYLPKSVRSIARLQTIVRVLASQGFEHLLQQLNLGRYLSMPQRWVRARPLEAEEPAAVGRRLVRVCQELGPTFVKLGQMLSTRPDLVPEHVVQELRLLQDRVEPFETEIARKVIAEDLGIPLDECFEEFGPEPMASGSIAQAYRARTKQGRRVVVKVKRPDIEQTIEQDMVLLAWLADAIERFVPESRPFRPRMLVDEFQKSIRRELDFVNEAATLSRFSEAFRDNDAVRIPGVLWELTGSRVLTMDFLDGVSMQSVIDSPGAEFDRREIARNLTESFFIQYFDLGMFHADPHPGNLLVNAPATIGLIDFGLVGRIDDELRGQFLMIMIALVSKEIDILVDTLDDLDALTPETDHAQLERDFRDLLDKYFGLPLQRIEIQTLFGEVNELVRNNGVVLPRVMVLLFKSLVTLAGVARQLDPEMNVLGLIRPRLRGMIRDRINPERLFRGAGITGWHMVTLFKQMPRQLRDFMRRLSRGQWQVNVNHQNLDYLASELDRSGNRLSFSIVIAAIIISSSMVLISDRTETLLGVPVRAFGLLGYVFAGIMGVGLVWAIWRSGKLS